MCKTLQQPLPLLLLPVSNNQERNYLRWAWGTRRKNMAAMCFICLLSLATTNLGCIPAIFFLNHLQMCGMRRHTRITCWLHAWIKRKKGLLGCCILYRHSLQKHRAFRWCKPRSFLTGREGALLPLGASSCNKDHREALSVPEDNKSSL